jgi:hypothetical protein
MFSFFFSFGLRSSSRNAAVWKKIERFQYLGGKLTIFGWQMTKIRMYSPVPSPTGTKETYWETKAPGSEVKECIFDYKF